jgi:ABC-2 type transport system permease protein
LIVEELEKQYEVVRIDPNSPFEEDVDVLMVVQPSSLTQPQMDNLVAAVRKGTPTAIFEDPMPVMMNAPGTSQPKAPQGGMMGMGAPPEPKGDIQALWDALGIKMVGQQQFGRFDASVVWQDYNPYKKARGFRQITKEWVFASPEAPGGEGSLNPSDEVVAGLQQILLLFPGAIQVNDNPALTVTPMITTGSFSGTIAYQDLTMGRDPLQLEFKRQPSLEPLTLAVRVRSRDESATDDSVSQSSRSASSTLPVTQAADTSDSAQAADSTDRAAPTGAAAATESTTTGSEPTPDEASAVIEANKPEPAKIDVVYVGDIDLMHSEFLRVRAQANLSDINWQFDNVTFVLNVIDDLAGDDRFLDVRKKQTRHSTLKFVEAKTADARADADAEIDRFSSEFEELEAAAREKQEAAIAELQKKIDELTQKARESGTEASGREIQRSLQAAVQQMAMKERVEQRRLDTTVETLTRDRDRKLREIERQLDGDVQHVQNICKALALFLPMLPPLAIGLAVFVHRRSLESEGISSSRRR